MLSNGKIKGGCDADLKIKFISLPRKEKTEYKKQEA